MKNSMSRCWGRMAVQHAPLAVILPRLLGVVGHCVLSAIEN